jgi:hypothetical protein
MRCRCLTDWRFSYAQQCWPPTLSRDVHRHNGTRIDWNELWGVACNDGMDSPRNVRGIEVPTLP